MPPPAAAVAAAGAAAVDATFWDEIIVRPALENGQLILSCTMLFFVIQAVSHYASEALVPLSPCARI